MLIRVTCSHNERQTNKTVVAVVGIGRSSTSVLAVKLGEVFVIHIISTTASSADLSDKVKVSDFLSNRSS